MTITINRQTAARIAGLELNALTAAGALPALQLEGAKVAATSTPIYDINGEILFYRVPVHGTGVEGFADIAAYAGFGDLLLRVARGFEWDEKALIGAAETAAKKTDRNLKFDETRFVAYSYPKIAVQFLARDHEVLMLELGSWAVVPPPKRANLDEPPGNFERWSLVVAKKPAAVGAGQNKMQERLAFWEKHAPFTATKEFKAFDAFNINVDKFKAQFEPYLKIQFETHRVAYGPRTGDHSPCFELRGQQTPVWCVAASVQAVLDYYRFNYDQTRIAADLGLGTLEHPNGLPYSQANKVVEVLEALSSNALDANMDTTPTFAEMRTELLANRPIITWIPGHSRAVAGFTSTRIFATYTFRGLLVYDPWPPTNGVITEWENFDTMTYDHLFKAQVQLAAAGKPIKAKKLAGVER